MSSNTSEEIVQQARDHLQIAYQEGGNPVVTASFYSRWAQENNYEKHLNKEIYDGPRIAAQAVADHFPTSERDGVHILDVAAGTGFVAEALSRHGFTKIDALDPSENMLRKSRAKNIYNHIICAYLDDNKLPVLEDTYDCAVTSGGMGEGHIPYTGLNQLVRVVKPGGLVCIMMREQFLEASQYKDKLELHMTRLANEGCWELLERTVVPNYCFNLSGLVYKFRVLPGKSNSDMMISSKESESK